MTVTQEKLSHLQILEKFLQPGDTIAYIQCGGRLFECIFTRWRTCEFSAADEDEHIAPSLVAYINRRAITSLLFHPEDDRR